MIVTPGLPVIDVSATICCAPVSAALMTDDAAFEVALRLKALADPVRIKLMSTLRTTDDGEVCTSDLANLVGLAESHLALIAMAASSPRPGQPTIRGKRRR